MKLEGNAKFYVNKFVNKDGSARYAVSVGVFSKKKDSDEYARVFVPCIMSKDIKIGEKTQEKFTAHIDEASLMASEYNGKSELKIFIAKISAPVEEAKPEKAAKKEDEGTELPY